MALKIIRGDEPIKVEQLVVTIYGPPGLGKSTLAFSANKILLLDFDRGAHRAANRGDSVQIESWNDVTTISEADLANYSTIAVDTAGRALDQLSADIIRRNPKMGRGGALTLQGYGQLKSEFTAWLKHLRTMGKDVVLIAHSSEHKSGDDIIERIDMQGGSKGEVYKVADAMGRLSNVPGKRLPVLSFSPCDTAFGKNPGQLEPLDVPDVATNPQFLGSVIDTIKERLNALTQVQKDRQSAIQIWMNKIAAANDAEAVNALIPETQSAPEDIRQTIKGLLNKHATESLALAYDQTTGGYGEKEAA